MEKSPRDSMACMKAKLVDSSSDEAFSTSESESEFSPLHGSPRKQHKEKTKFVLERMPKYPCSFFILGATLTAPFAVTVCAAEDMLAGTAYATGWVLIAAAVPSCLAKLLFLISSCLRNLSLVTRVLGMFIFMIIGLFFVAFSASDLRFRLLGVCLVSVGTGVGEITLLVYAATMFQEVALASFIAGTATGGVLSALPYVGMTSWSSVNPRAAILVPVLWPSFHLLVFAMMKTKRLCAEVRTNSHIRQEIYEYESQSAALPFYQERILEIWKSVEHLVLIFLVYFSVYLSLGAILSTMVFSHTKDFGPREQFQHYILSTLLGEFLGRSFMSLLRAKTPGVHYRIPVVCGLVPIGFMLLFVFATWFHFIYRIWVIFVLCFMQGASSGVVAANAYHSIANRTLAQHAVFLLLLASLLESLGVMSAGLIGLQTEPALRMHCVESQYYTNASDCLTRSTSALLWSNGRGGRL